VLGRVTFEMVCSLAARVGCAVLGGGMGIGSADLGVVKVQRRGNRSRYNSVGL
jgi:hypothetical protein